MSFIETCGRNCILSNYLLYICYLNPLPRSSAHLGQLLLQLWPFTTLYIHRIQAAIYSNCILALSRQQLVSVGVTIIY